MHLRTLPKQDKYADFETTTLLTGGGTTLGLHQQSWTHLVFLVQSGKIELRSASIIPILEELRWTLIVVFSPYDPSMGSAALL
jgi:hypothetical protein